jgi:hypothetical protein
MSWDVLQLLAEGAGAVSLVPGWQALGAGGRPTATAAGASCLLRVSACAAGGAEVAVAGTVQGESLVQTAGGRGGWRRGSQATGESGRGRGKAASSAIGVATSRARQWAGF